MLRRQASCSTGVLHLDVDCIVTNLLMVFGNTALDMHFPDNLLSVILRAANTLMDTIFGRLLTAMIICGWHEILWLYIQARLVATSSFHDRTA